MFRTIKNTLKVETFQLEIMIVSKNMDRYYLFDNLIGMNYQTNVSLKKSRPHLRSYHDKGFNSKSNIHVL